MSLARREIWVAVATGLVLWMLLAQLNHYLSVWQIHVWGGGLFATFASLRFRFADGLWVALILGAVHDAAAPVPFGLHALLFGLAHAVIFVLRHRFPREEMLVAVAVTLIANLGLFLVLSFTRMPLAPPSVTVWVRLFADLFFSQVAIIVISPWFLSLQGRAMEIAGASLRTEQRGVI